LGQNIGVLRLSLLASIYTRGSHQTENHFQEQIVFNDHQRLDSYSAQVVCKNNLNTSPSRWNMNNAVVVGSGFFFFFILLKAAHIAGAKIVLANHLSRIRIKPLMVVEHNLFLKMIFSLVAPSGI
jgi:hypothetical protein